MFANFDSQDELIYGLFIFSGRQLAFRKKVCLFFKQENCVGVGVDFEVREGIQFEQKPPYYDY
jgi:hypothetical protein